MDRSIISRPWETRALASKPAVPTAAKNRRPRSPHLFRGPGKLHYRWGPAMTVSIFHRATGSGMATIGSLLLVWWLAAIAAGDQAYATFRDVFTTSSGALNPIGWIVGVALTWAVFQHMASGIRHLFLDAGAAYELKVNKTSAALTFVFSIVMTIVFWLYIGIKA
jgi:succinate dehydrogenase / fumarate reductase cytochrome b subunit